MKGNMQWFSAKILYKHKTEKNEISGYYEERLIVINISDEDDSYQEALKRAKEYANETRDCKFVKIIDIYEMYCNGKIKNGQEIYSKFYSTNQSAKEFMSARYLNSKLADCEKENCSHSWHKWTEKTMKCYYCNKTKRNIFTKVISAS